MDARDQSVYSQQQYYDSQAGAGSIMLQQKPPFIHYWKMADAKAQKNGPHRSVYWVKKKPKQEDGTIKGEIWQGSSRYIGDWRDNCKEGFGIQFYNKGDKYEGMWAMDKKHGQGTYWRNENGKLRREYTGDWFEDKKHGRGTFFFKNSDRYDGYWVNGMPQGEGRMIYADGNIYEGQWHEGKRNGYGVLTKRNGDHFEGHWVNDKREGQGSYFYSDKNKLFVGEWVDDQPKTGVYTEVEDEDADNGPKKPYFQDPYVLPPIPELKLADPTNLLEKAMERTKRVRSHFRVQFIPLEEMFTSQELMDLRAAFDAVSMGQDYVDRESLQNSFSNLGIFPSEEMLDELLTSIGKLQKEDLITFEVFARCVALLLEENTDKISTSSQQNMEEDQEGEFDENDPYGQEMQDPYGQEDPYYNETYEQQYAEEQQQLMAMHMMQQQQQQNM